MDLEWRLLTRTKWKIQFDNAYACMILFIRNISRRKKKNFDWTKAKRERNRNIKISSSLSVVGINALNGIQNATISSNVKNTWDFMLFPTERLIHKRKHTTAAIVSNQLNESFSLFLYIEYTQPKLKRIHSLCLLSSDFILTLGSFGKISWRTMILNVKHFSNDEYYFHRHELILI